MSRKDKTWLAAGLLVAVAGAGFLALRSTGPRERAAGSAGEAPGFGGFHARDLAPSPPVTPEEIAKRVEAAMSAWRNAILVRDADAVLALDREFTGAPARYTPALVTCAETDSDQRVRAFCTRVLGKFKSLDRVELFERLLADKSPYVRQNAAWALGELAETTNGHMVTRHALAELRHVHAKDPAGDVRVAAKDALEKLE